MAASPFPDGQNPLSPQPNSGRGSAFPEPADALMDHDQLLAMFMQAPISIAVTRGPNHVYQFANERYLQVYGRREIIGHPAAEVIPEAQQQGIIALADSVYATGTPMYGYEEPFEFDFDGDGVMEQRYFNVVMQPVRDASGTIDGLMLLTSDVTEQVLARREVERLAREQAAIVSHIADGVVLADKEGHIVYMNPAAQSIYGVAPEDAGIEQYSRHFHLYTLEGEPHPIDTLPMTRAVRYGETVTGYPLLVRRSADRSVIVSTSAAPVVLDSGEFVGAVLTARDITREYETDRQKDQFLSAAAHDLKTPLTGIKGFTQIVQRRLMKGPVEDPAPLLEGLRRIDATTTKMTALINELLDLSRIQMGRPLDLLRRPVDLVQLTTVIVEEVRANAPRHHLTLCVASPDIEGLWDGYRVERVLNNLLSNAVKYSPDGGEIIVTVREDESEDERWAVVSIQDFGIGIPDGDLPNIFERFYRGSNVGPTIHGTGIGLAAVQQIVEQHSGRLLIDSLEGAGTTVTLMLPLTE